MLYKFNYSPPKRYNPQFLYSLVLGDVDGSSEHEKKIITKITKII